VCLEQLTGLVFVQIHGAPSRWRNNKPRSGRPSAAGLSSTAGHRTHLGLRPASGEGHAPVTDIDRAERQTRR
jgi:hypothetical protein